MGWSSCGDKPHIFNPNIYIFIYLLVRFSHESLPAVVWLGVFVVLGEQSQWPSLTEINVL